MSDSWDIPSAISLYNVDRWGSGYFSINRSGNIQVMPTQQESLSIDLMEVVQEARDRGMSFPLVIRFQDLLRHRVETVNRAFQSAIAEAMVQRRIAAGASLTRCLSPNTTASSRTRSSPPQPPGPWMSATVGAIAISSVKASRQAEG